MHSGAFWVGRRERVDIGQSLSDGCELCMGLLHVPWRENLHIKVLDPIYLCHARERMLWPDGGHQLEPCPLVMTDLRYVDRSPPYTPALLRVRPSLRFSAQPKRLHSASTTFTQRSRFSHSAGKLSQSRELTGTASLHGARRWPWWAGVCIYRDFHNVRRRIRHIR